MITGHNPPHAQNWEQAFEDWVALLKRADAMDLLEDPKAIWDEAWRQACILNAKVVTS